MAEKNLRLFGEIAIAEGICSREQIDAALQQQRTLRDRGIKKTLGAVLHDLEILSLVQVNLVLEKVDSTRRRHSIEGYEIISKLGKGGMGAVYLAKRLNLQKLVALKVLSPKLAQNKDYLGRFQREAAATAKLNHPNIVAAIDVGESNGYNYFVMEYVEGETLQDALKETGIIEEPRALELITRMAEALHHAWEHGIVHRDIKPANIMISKTGVPKLCDLGLAIDTAGSDQTITRAGVIMGTPYYLSPEQARSAKLDIRSDIYSLGATFFHMATGRVPYDGETPAIVITKHLHDPPPDPLSHNPLLSNGLCYIVDRMMAKQPDERYQSPEELLEDLRELTETHGLEGKRYVPQTREAALRARRRVREGRLKLVAWLVPVAASVLTVSLLWPGLWGQAVRAVSALGRLPGWIRDASAELNPVSEASEEERENHAHLAMVEAERMIAQKPNDHSRARGLLEEVITSYPDTRTARRAEERLKVHLAQLDQDARAVFFELSQRARVHLEHGRYGEARAALASFPDALRGTTWSYQVQRERELLEQSARDALATARARVPALMDEGRFEEARALTRPLAGSGLEDIDPIAEAILKAINDRARAAAIHEAEALIRRARKELDQRFDEVRRVVETQGLRAGAATVRAAAEEAGESAPLLFRLGDDLEALERAREREVESLAEQVGTALVLRIGGVERAGVLQRVDSERIVLQSGVAPVAYPFVDLDPQAWLTADRIGNQAAANRLTGLLHLLGGDRAKAQAALAAARALGEEVALYEQQLTR